MFMRYRGGGAGHSSTREATNKFLLDRDWLDVSDVDKGVEEEDDIDDCEHRTEDGRSPKDNEAAGGDDGDKDDEGRISGGDNVEADGAVEDWEIGLEGNEADDYGYGRPVEEDSDNSEAKPDLPADALGPEDGEGEGDEMYLDLRLCRVAKYVF